MLRIWVFESDVFKNLFILSKHGTKANIKVTKMANNRMHTIGMSFKAIGRQMGYHYTVVSRLVRKHTQTNNVKDLPRSGRPRVTSDRDNMALQRLVRRMPFATSPVLKQH
jgi:transposase